MIEPGVYLDLSSELYHGDKNSLSRSALMDFKRSPFKYWSKHLNPDRPPEKTKDSWEFGTAFHTLILEPHLFDEQYIMEPEPVKLKDVGRELYDKYKGVCEYIETCGKKVLSQKEFTTLCDMRDALYRNGRAKELIEGAIYESSYFWKDEASGLMVKSRPDILQPGAYIDLKSIDNASPESYQREMYNYGYHTQGAMVIDALFKTKGEVIESVINICVEKTYPYSIGIYFIDELALEAGHHEYKRLLVEMKECKDKNEWPDYEPQIIGLPRWAT